MLGCRGQSLFPSFVAALKAKPGTDEESKKQGVLVQVRCRPPQVCDARVEPVAAIRMRAIEVNCLASSPGGVVGWLCGVMPFLPA